MKEIKFRAWDKIALQWFDPWESDGDFGIARDGTLLSRDARGLWGYEKEYEPDDLIIMQFTGLHDKNGVEVYEGDIIEVESDIPTYIGVVGFDCASFMVKADHITGYCWMDYEITILGNIYENPELIDKEEDNE